MLENTLALTLLGKIVPLAGSILAFLSIVTVHEFGHFIFCKIFNVRTPTFSVGIGPVLFKREFWGTEFQLALLPLGGFVEIGGLSEPGQGEQEHAQDESEQSFTTKPYWQKMLILWGGICFNLIFAFLIYSGLFLNGMPKSKIQEIKITTVTAGGPAEQAGLCEGDILVGIDKKFFKTTETPISANEFGNKIMSSNGIPVHFYVKRNEKTIDLMITPTSDDPEDAASPARIKAGLSSTLEYEKTPGIGIIASFSKSISLIAEQVVGSFSTIKTLIKKRTLEGIGGPVMIASQLFKTAESSFYLFLLLIASVNIGLATMNILPLGALDGGQILFATLEMILQRKLSDSFKIGVNVVSIVLFGLLFAYLIFKDTLAIFGK